MCWPLRFDFIERDQSPEVTNNIRHALIIVSKIELNFTTAIFSNVDSFKLCYLYVNFRYNFLNPSALGI